MPGLPRGTVAFVFTDIEGSTRLWERDAAAMRRAVERHNAILGAAIAAHAGHHFKTIGDAFQAAFPDVSSAIAAVVAAQRALAAEPWPETGPIAVRMAIHVGEATPSEGDRPDYLAPALNRLARLLSAGHGGQALLSGVARALASGDLPPGVTLRDLGRHRLRDLLEPEQIWQLVIPGLPDAFPALRTLEGHHTNLPAQPASLIGRDALLAALLPVVTSPETRLLTLTGPGGVGKTRLAVQLAADALDAFPDGVWFVDLSDATGPAAFLPEIAAVLGVREGGGLSLPEATIALLAPKRLLLVLDNLEQIRPAHDLGRQLAELLAAAPSLTMLATSRAPLRIRAEREWPLDPLAVPDSSRPLPASVLAENPAVSLFVERARAAKPAFALTEANAAAVAEIVQRLDGLPLAMELAAARLRALSPAQLRDRLGTRLDLLFGPGHDRPDRHQTLRATIAWSHDLLAPDLQAFFRRAGVFASGFTLEAAEAVASDIGGPAPDALGAVEELLAESLLRAEETPEGDMRYRMLETVRAFARERLDASGEAEAAHAAHLAYFTRWAEETAAGLVALERAATLDRIEAEYANLRAALAWTLDAARPGDGLALASRIWKFWQYRAHLSEGRSWLRRLLDATADDPSHERAMALEGAGVLAWNQGDLSAARALLERSLAIAQARSDALGQVRGLNNLGNVINLMGDLEGAEALFNQGLALTREIGDARQEATILNNLALIAMDRGELDDSRGLLEQSLALKERLGVRAEMALVMANLALIAWLKQDLPAAITLLEEALAIERETENPVGIADALGNLAQIVAQAGDLSRAIPLHRECLLIRQEVDDWLSMPYSLEAIAGMAVQCGRVAEAVRLYAASAAQREATQAPIPATDRPSYDAALEHARATLGEDAFAARWREGRALGRDEAVAAALALCDAIDANPTSPEETGSPTLAAAGSPTDAAI